MSSLVTSLIILILIIFNSDKLNLHPTINVAEAIPFSEYRNKIKTGDIIVLYNSGFTSSLVRIYDQSSATHAGVIIVENDKIYVCEIDFHTYFSSDVHTSDIDKFMTVQRCPYIGIIPIQKSLPIRLSDVEKINYKYDLTLGFCPLPGRVHCTMLVHRILSWYGIQPLNGAAEHETTPRTYYADPSIILLDYNR